MSMRSARGQVVVLRVLGTGRLQVSGVNRDSGTYPCMYVHMPGDFGRWSADRVDYGSALDELSKYIMRSSLIAKPPVIELRGIEGNGLTEPFHVWKTPE